MKEQEKRSNIAGKAIKYVLLPGILSRFHALFTSGFSTCAYFMAAIFQGLRLLPDSHPYTQPENFGKYGLRHVLGAAGANLKYDWKHADQVIIFYTIALGLILLMVQFGLLIAALFAQQPVFAQTILTEGDFFTRNISQHHQDLAMILMDRVFGLPNFFHSCVSTISTPCTNLQGANIGFNPTSFPFPFHLAMQQMLAFYSYGLFVVAVMVILYFITVIISETAASGTPFGQRYNKTWIPVRLILFFALLIPITSGYNSAQLIIFAAAKAGSNFASNAWDRFNDTLTGQQLTGAYDLIAKPTTPELDQIVQFMFIARTCKKIEETERLNIYGSAGIQPYLVRATPLLSSGGTSPDHLDLIATGFEQAVQHAGYGKMVIRFGSHMDSPGNPENHNHENYEGNVKPVCGDISLDLTSMKSSGSASFEIQRLYYNLVKQLWLNPLLTQNAECLALRHSPTAPDPDCTPYPDEAFFQGILISTRIAFKASMEALIAMAAADGSLWNVSAQLKEKGWAGAAIWYNRIAELNGEVTTSVFHMPIVDRYPLVMEYVAEKKKAEEEDLEPSEMFNPLLRNGEMIQFNGHPKDKDIAPILYKAYKFWNMDINYSGTGRLQENPLMDLINYIFGINGLYDMMENPNVNPLAQLSALGKGIMEAAIRNLTVGMGGSLIGRVLNKMPGQLLKVGADFVQLVGYTMLPIGFTLYYVLPLMPFIYFFFAVGGWIKGIFEATVAAPLWAMSHITRWDGEGIAGPGAQNGYFLVFEIFLRPIMILFGMLASIIIFSAMVMVLNDVYATVIANVGGFNKEAELTGAISLDDMAGSMRGTLDQFFYTVIYAVIVYMMGLSAFKLIDAIPNEILRWMNFTVKTFQEENKNAAEGLSRTANKGATIATSKLSGQSLQGSSLASLG